MRQNACVRHFCALFIALFLLPLLISGNELDIVEDFQRGSFEKTSISICNTIGYVEIVCLEDSLISNTIRFIRCDSTKKVTRSCFFEYFICGNSILLLAARLLFIYLLVYYRRICGSLKNIIKYIHDKDGHKNKTSFICCAV